MQPMNYVISTASFIEIGLFPVGPVCVERLARRGYDFGLFGRIERRNRYIGVFLILGNPIGQCAAIVGFLDTVGCILI